MTSATLISAPICKHNRNNGTAGDLWHAHSHKNKIVTVVSAPAAKSMSCSTSAKQLSHAATPTGEARRQMSFPHRPRFANLTAQLRASPVLLVYVGHFGVSSESPPTSSLTLGANEPVQRVNWDDKTHESSCTHLTNLLKLNVDNVTRDKVEIQLDLNPTGRLKIPYEDWVTTLTPPGRALN